MDIRDYRQQFENMSVDELWALFTDVDQILAARIVAKKEELERRLNRNRHEQPRRQLLASAGVADRHPILAHGLDGRRDIAVGVAQELLGLAGLVCRSEQRTALIVFTVNQDGQ